jgi:urease accessory protein
VGVPHAMTAAMSLPRHQRARGIGRIATQVLDGRTRLTTLFQEGCAKIRLPHTHDTSLQAVLINTAGGLTGGDDVAWEAKTAPGARRRKPFSTRAAA